MRARWPSKLVAPGHRKAPRREMGGFTLIELLVTISIAAILAVLAVPTFNSIALSSKLNSIASSFMTSAQVARSEAIKRNSTVTLCASSDGTTCSGSWQNGWVVLAGTSVISSQAALPSGYLMSDSGGLTSIVFQPTGVGATMANLTLCRSAPTPGDQKRTIQISATGRPDLTKVTGASTCP